MKSVYHCKVINLQWWVFNKQFVCYKVSFQLIYENCFFFIVIYAFVLFNVAFNRLRLFSLYLCLGVEYQKCYKWQQVFSMFVFYLKSLWHFFFTPRVKIIAPVAWENRIQKRERLFAEKKFLILPSIFFTH